MDLNVEFLSYRLRSPLIAASGPPTMDWKISKALADAGIGAIITKTILMEPSVNPRPCLYHGGSFFLNTERCSTKPTQEWLDIELPAMAELGIPIIASIGMTPEDAEQLAGPVVAAGANGVELSIFTPVDDPAPMQEAIRRVRAQVDVPILCKLSCNVSDVVAFARAFQEAGADGVSAIDALKAAVVLDPRTGEPAMREQGFARMSGSALLPVALYHVSQVAHYTGLSIVGTGGVSDGQDVIDMISCGAGAVGICSQLIVEGPEAVERIHCEVQKAAEKLNAEELTILSGRSLDYIDFTSDDEERQEYEKRAWRSQDLTAKVDSETCIRCGRCETICLYHAIAHSDSGDYRVSSAVCEGCGLCLSSCPVGAIGWSEGEQTA